MRITSEKILSSIISSEHKMKSKFTRLMVILSILAILSLACGIGGKKEPTSTSRPTVVRATKTLKPPTDTAAPPTNTWVPPTMTPVPSTSTPAATATLVPDLSLGEQNRCDVCGFSFRAIPGYSLKVEANTVTMLAEGADPDIGPMVMLIGGPPDPTMTTEALFESFKGGEAQLSEPSDILVAGLKGKSTFITGVKDQVDMAGQVVIISTSEQYFVAVGGSSKEQWQREGSARFSAVLNTIAFFTPTAPVEPTPTSTTGMLVEIRQWADSAIASSWYGTGTNWSPSQAAGEPNVSTCSDDAYAWASLSSGTVEWIELTYANPVNPTQVNIVQSYNPSYVVKVELKDTLGNYHEIYSGKGAEVGSCPFTLSIPVESVGYQANAVKITIDQSTLDDWNEIDAVELVGKGTASASSTVTPGDVGVIAPTPEGFVIPAGFLWRLGGKTSFEENSFITIEGMDTDENNLLYVADGLQGIWVFDANGEKVRVIDDPEMSQASDVKVGADGNIYVAAWGSNQVFVFTADGALVTKFGGEGKGNGQFGQFSPQELAVGPDGRIYVYDENENDAGEDVDRIQVFSSQGQWLKSFPLESEWDAPDGMSFGPDGSLYTVGFMSDAIVQYDPDGKLLNKLEIADGLGGPQGLDIDSAGKFYIASWDKGVLKLDPQGNLLGQWGVWAGDAAGEQDWVEGTFYRPAGVGVLRDGSQVFFCEWSNMFAYLTAFQFK
jgi:sugar lactone lactonase YvrE